MDFKNVCGGGGPTTTPSGTTTTTTGGPTTTTGGPTTTTGGPTTTTGPTTTGTTTTTTTTGPTTTGTTTTTTTTGPTTTGTTTTTTTTGPTTTGGATSSTTLQPAGGCCSFRGGTIYAPPDNWSANLNVAIDGTGLISGNHVLNKVNIGGAISWRVTFSPGAGPSNPQNVASIRLSLACYSTMGL